MANIKISDLQPVGSEFFSDSENYMDEISEGEFNHIVGGSSPVCLSVGARVASMSSVRCYQSIVAVSGYTVKNDTGQKIGNFLGGGAEKVADFVGGLFD